MATGYANKHNRIVRWYLRAARARLRRDLPPPFRRILPCSPHMMELVRNIDHWLAQLPFHETHRTFARLDYSIAMVLPSGEFAALRGWIVDLDDSVTAIRFPDVSSAEQFVHLGDDRPDLAKRLPAERTRNSGFVALVPMQAVQGRRYITVSYTVRRGSSHTFSLPLPALAFGVRHPPSPELEPLALDLSEKILIAAQCGDGSDEIVASLSTSLSGAAAQVEFVREAPEMAREATDADIAGAIGRHRSACRLIVIVGRLTPESYDGVVPTLVAAFPHPRLVWISTVAPAHIVDPRLIEVITWQPALSEEIARRLLAIANGLPEAE